MRLAVSQATEVAQLRGKASSLTTAGYILPDNANLVQAIEYALDPLKANFNTQLREASARISKLEMQSETSRDEARELRIAADALFEEAEQAGIVGGYQSYKRGVETMRQSQQIDLAAATIELQSQMEYAPLHEDAKAELEAIASILAGVKYTGELLTELRDTSIDSASDLRRFATKLELEYFAEENGKINEVIEAASSLRDQWDNVTTLLQDAIELSNQNRSVGQEPREKKQAAAMWKLNLEWTLGQIQESKRRFLMEEAQALTSIIEFGIIPQVNRWQTLSSSASSGVEEATINAIAAYENAKQLASRVGSQSDVHARQLDLRISILQGTPIHELIAPDNANQALPTPTPTSAPTSHPPTAGFASPQDLITAFNQLPTLEDLDGTQSAPDVSKFYTASDDMGQKFIDFQQGMLSGVANLLIAIRTHMGADAVSQFKSTVPTRGGMSVTLDANSLAMAGDNEASVNDVTGKTFHLQKSTRGWIIILTSRDEGAEMAAMMIEMLAPILEIMNQATQQINDGQITSIEQLETMMDSAMGM